MKRRKFLKLFSLLMLTNTSLLSLMACKRGFKRPIAEFDLGEVKTLLRERTHLAEKSFLVVRDRQGWGAMSTRCAKDGCDLTYQEQNLLCSCCKSIYAFDGRVLQGPSEWELPWYRIRYVDNHLYANTGSPAKPTDRYTTEEIELALEKLRAEVAEMDLGEGVEIPQILLGNESGLRGNIVAE